MDIVAVKDDGALRRIDDQGTEIEDLLVLRVLGDDLRPVHAPEQRLAAGDEFAHGERLGHIVVGSRTEADDLIGLVIACGEDEHRHRTVGHDTLRGFKTVHYRQHDVHDDQIRSQLSRRLNGACPVSGNACGPTFGGDALGDGCGQRRFIFDDQHGAGLSLLLCC